MSRLRIKKATPEERLAHHGVYPLFGFVTVKGHEVKVEDLSGSDPEFRYEALGKRSPMNTHEPAQGPHQGETMKKNQVVFEVKLNGRIGYYKKATARKSLASVIREARDVYPRASIDARIVSGMTHAEADEKLGAILRGEI